MPTDPRDVLSVNYRDEHFSFEVEARWAVFFDRIGVEWHYKHVFNYNPDDLYPYRPTFYLPHIYLRNEEKTGTIMSVSTYSEGIVQEDNLLKSIAEKFSLNAIIANQFRLDPQTNEPQDLYQLVPFWDNMIMIYRCNCGAVKFEYQESNYMCCHHKWCKRDQFDLENAFLYAANYKF